MQEKDKKMLAVGIMAGVCIAAVLMVLGNLLAAPGTPNDTVSVPDFVGLQEDAVKDVEKYANFDLRFSEIHDGSETAGDHVIYAQSVKAGTKVSEGTTITLSVNLKYTVLRLPAFVDGKLTAAEKSLDVYGALYNVSYQWTEDPALDGRVAAQEPAPNTVISVLDTPVNLTVWTTDAALADPDNAPAQTAAPAETAAPTEVPTATETPAPTEAPAETAAPTPVPTPAVQRDSLLKRLVSGFLGLFAEEGEAEIVPTPAAGEAGGGDTPQSTPEPQPGGTALPDVTGKSYEEACGVLEAAGFHWVYYEHREGGGAPAETVLSQDPAAGSVLDPTTHINLVLAR